MATRHDGAQGRHNNGLKRTSSLVSLSARRLTQC